MQKLFYVVGRWLEEDNSRQSTRISDMIKQQMQKVGFNYDSISNTERQREQLYREREKLIKEKQKLQEQKRQIQLERQHNIKLIEEKQKLQRQRSMIEQRLHEEKQQAQELKQENEELQEKRKTMVEEYQKLQDERDKIIEERQVLFERMQKIQKLQRLQKMYQEELRRLREQAQNQGERMEEEKNQQEEQNQIQVMIPSSQQTFMSGNGIRALNREEAVQKEEDKGKNFESQLNSSPVAYSSGFQHVSTGPPQYTGVTSFTSQQYRYVPSSQYSSTHTYTPQMTNYSTQTHPVSNQSFVPPKNGSQRFNNQSVETNTNQGVSQSSLVYHLMKKSSQNQQNEGQDNLEKK